VQHADRLLLGPGPSNAYPEVMEAFARPVLGHLDPDFLVVLDEIADRLRLVFRTDNALTLPISGTGSAGMEACFVNLLEPGDTAIIGVNGVFGERMCDVAARCGAEVVRVDEEWGRAIDPQRLLDAQRASPRARLLAVVHAETSTGVENDIAPLAAVGDTDTLLLVDTVTSLGGIPVDVDGWRADAVYSGTQKCLGVPPGLAPVTFSARAVERVRSRSRSSPTTSAALVATTTPHRSRCCTRCTQGSVCCSTKDSTRRGSGTAASVRCCNTRCPSSASDRSRRSDASRSSLPYGSPTVPTTRSCAASCASALASKSAAAWARSRARAGASASWATPRENAPSPRSWVRSTNSSADDVSAETCSARDAAVHCLTLGA
jgi:hypothetical protein